MHEAGKLLVDSCSLSNIYTHAQENITGYLRLARRSMDLSNGLQSLREKRPVGVPFPQSNSNLIEAPRKSRPLR